MTMSPKPFSILITAGLIALGVVLAPAHAEAHAGTRKHHQQATYYPVGYSTPSGYPNNTRGIFSWMPSTGNPLSYDPYATTPTYTYGYAPLTYPMSYQMPSAAPAYPMPASYPASYPQNYPPQNQNQNYPTQYPPATTPYNPPQNPVTPTPPAGGNQSGGFTF